jgi:hypothetical protein
MTKSAESPEIAIGCWLEASIVNRVRCGFVGLDDIRAAAKMARAVTIAAIPKPSAA